jgi:hypothetical protein
MVGKIKNLWALRYVIVMFAALASVIAAFIWVVRELPVYTCAGILLVIVASIIDRPNARRRQARIKVLVDGAYHRSYSSLSVPPKLVRSSVHGYPAFEVSFGSKREMEGAATCNAAFKEEIAAIFKSRSWIKAWGPFFQPFSADKAIFFTYDGYLDELRARIKAL